MATGGRVISLTLVPFTKTLTPSASRSPTGVVHVRRRLVLSLKVVVRLETGAGSNKERKKITEQDFDLRFPDISKT